MIIQGYLLTRHAKRRMNSRRISVDALDATLRFGRKVHVRGALVFAVGKREVREWARRGIDLSEYENLQTVCNPSGRVLTVYRSRNFRRLRPRSWRATHRRRRRGVRWAFDI